MPRSRKSVDRAAKRSVAEGSSSELSEVLREGGKLRAHPSRVLEKPGRDVVTIGASARPQAQPREERPHELEALAPTGPAERRHEVTHPSLEDPVVLLPLLPREIFRGEARLRGERGAEEEKVHDRIRFAPDEPLADLVIALPEPVGPDCGQAVVRDPGQTWGKGRAHRLEHRPGFFESNEGGRFRRRPSGHGQGDRDEDRAERDEGGGQRGDCGRADPMHGPDCSRNPRHPGWRPTSPVPVGPGPGRCPERSAPAGPRRGSARAEGEPRPADPGATAACPG